MDETTCGAIGLEGLEKTPRRGKFRRTAVGWLAASTWLGSEGVSEGIENGESRDGDDQSTIERMERKEQTQRLARLMRGRTCFVVMPFGKKVLPATEADRRFSDQHEEFDSEVTVDFNAVFDELIKPCIDLEKSGTPNRSDEHLSSGMIHRQMIQSIVESDLVIVDISGLNANVFYELGIRHTAQKNGTLILCRDGGMPPFNIAGMNTHFYPAFRTVKQWKDEINEDRVEEARYRLRAAILATLEPGASDSPVHTLVRGLNISRPQQPLKYQVGDAFRLNGFIGRNFANRDAKGQQFEPLRRASDLAKKTNLKRVGIIEGDLSRVDCVDAWVNPENTLLQMARPHDHSISAIIRSSASRHAGRRSRSRDRLAQALAAHARKCGGQVETGDAVAMPAYGLEKSHGLSAIVTLAAQTGMLGRGYQTTRNLEDCVENVLDEVDEWNRSSIRRIFGRRPIQSILFPLFGTANADWDPEMVAERLISAAAQYLTLWPDQKLERVYFLAYTDRDRAYCRSAFIRLGIANATDFAPPSTEDLDDEAETEIQS